MRLLFLSLIVGGCSENDRAKAFGGTMKVDLPCGEKLFDITWKENSFWYATTPFRGSDAPQTYTFREKSPHGVYEGKVIVTESACP